MDFVDLASSHSSLLRRLDQVFAEAATTTEQEGQQRPVFSKSAEAEIYILATNFLLYVALIIIVTIVAKIYFPESLDRSRGPSPRTLARSYSYRRAIEESQQSSSDHFLDDTSGDDDDIFARAEDDEDAEIEDLLLDSNNNTSDGRRRPNVLEFDQERTSKSQVLRRLLFCCFMLNLTFVTWGALQERMLTRRYPRKTGEYFVYSYAVSFTSEMSLKVLCTYVAAYL